MLIPRNRAVDSLMLAFGCIADSFYFFRFEMETTGVR